MLCTWGFTMVLNVKFIKTFFIHLKFIIMMSLFLSSLSFFVLSIVFMGPWMWTYAHYSLSFHPLWTMWRTWMHLFLPWIVLHPTIHSNHVFKLVNYQTWPSLTKIEMPHFHPHKKLLRYLHPCHEWLQNESQCETIHFN
jgi:hypothetical protein